VKGDNPFSEDGKLDADRDRTEFEPETLEEPIMPQILDTPDPESLHVKLRGTFEDVTYTD
jgi:hypothetical protein